MSTPKFTPGPWKYSSGWIVAPCDIAVAKVHCGAKGPLRVSDMEANAALIAAAPDLYAALEACLHDLAILASRDPENIRARRYEDAERAIARAEGRAP